MIKKISIILLIISAGLIQIKDSAAVDFLTTDLFTSDGSSSSDAKTFVNRALTMEIDSSSIMVSCFDFSNTNCDENSTYEQCFAANQQDFDDCVAFDSWLSGMGYTTDSTPATQLMPVSSATTTCADARYYKNCDGSGGGNLFGVTQKQYYVFSQRKFDCDGGSPSWYSYDAEGYISGSDYDYSQDISCAAYRKCSESNDDSYVTTYNGAITNPCRIDDGSTSNYACSVNSDCWSDNCGGAKVKERNNCDYDGSDEIYLQTQSWGNTCGESGYLISDWSNPGSQLYDCSEGGYAGPGYVCDEDHDDVEVTQPTTAPNPCRKNLGESCSLTTDCWNDDGGNWCNSISKCTDGANGRNCGSDSDCTSGRCDSTCMAKLADGASCDENSDCTNSNCISGYCGGPPIQVCNGTIEVNTNDVNNVGLQHLNVYLNNNYTGSTNEIGQKRLTLTQVSCDANQEIQVRCASNATICSTKTTQIDFNGDTDSLNFACAVCTPNLKDLYIGQQDVAVNVTSDKASITVHSIGITASSVPISVFLQDEDGIQKGSASTTFSISSDSTQTVTLTLSEGIDPEDFIHIYLGVASQNQDQDLTNNYIFRAAVKPITAFIDVTVDPSFNSTENAIHDYLTTFVEEADSPSGADVVIVVGNPLFSHSEPFGLGNKIVVNGKDAKKSYQGIVKSGPIFQNQYSSYSKPYILAYGEGIEGDIAAVKRLINARTLFLNTEFLGDYYTSYIDEFDTLGLSVMDLMHNNESQTYITQNNNGTAEVVEKILFDNNFEIAVKPVKTLNTTSYGSSTVLRVKNVNSDFSEDYRDAVGVSAEPVVFSGGIFSDLESWEYEKRFLLFEVHEGLAKQLANEGFDVWEIEITGGPETDCTGKETDTCPNYTYDDLVDYYWPASIAGISEYSGKNKFDYIGHSSGCRVALSSLHNYSNTGKGNAGYYFDFSIGQYLESDLPQLPIDKFIGLGCPGVLNEGSVLIDTARQRTIPVIGEYIGEYVPPRIPGSHIRMFDYAWRAQAAHILNPLPDYNTKILLLASLFTGSEKISKNLLNYYISFALNSSSDINLSNFNVTEVHLFHAKAIHRLGLDILNDDVLVPFSDQQEIASRLKVPVFNYTVENEHHTSMTSEETVKQIIKEELL